MRTKIKIDGRRLGEKTCLVEDLNQAEVPRRFKDDSGFPEARRLFELLSLSCAVPI
jgi:hypothetical protein